MDSIPADEEPFRAARPSADIGRGRVDVVGEALVDLIHATDGRYDAVAGGAPANVAIGLARLGVPCRFLGALGSDHFGEMNRDRLRLAGVDLSAVATVERPTSLAVVSNTNGSPSYSFHLDGTADRAWGASDLPPDAPAAIHVGSLAAAIEPSRTVIAGHVERLAAADATTIGLDPNIRPLPGFDRAAEADRVLRLARHAHLVKASDDDLALLHPGDPIDVVLSRWRRRGVAAEVIVTHGADGATLHRPSGAVIAVPTTPVRVVDTVGAGDAFVAATLAGLFDLDALGAEPVARLAALTDAQWASILGGAVAAAALTCGRPGADPPTRSQWTAARG